MWGVQLTVPFGICLEELKGELKKVRVEIERVKKELEKVRS